MKIGKIFEVKAGTAFYETMPEKLQALLHNMSVNEAITEGLVTDLGNAKAEIIFDDANFDGQFAVVNGYKVSISERLQKLEAGNIEAMVGLLRFNKGISTQEGDGFNKPFFRLGAPRGSEAGDAIVTLSAKTQAAIAG